MDRARNITSLGRRGGIGVQLKRPEEKGADRSEGYRNAR